LRGLNGITTLFFFIQLDLSVNLQKMVSMTELNKSFCKQAVKETGIKFRETVLALGGGKSPLQVIPV
jgi:hypothetical protein